MLVVEDARRRRWGRTGRRSIGITAVTITTTTTITTGGIVVVVVVVFRAFDSVGCRRT